MDKMPHETAMATLWLRKLEVCSTYLVHRQQTALFEDTDRTYKA